MKKLAAGLALVAVLGLAHARSTTLVEPERVALVSASAVALTPQLVKLAIARGGARHQWAVVSDQPGKMQLKFNKLHDNLMLMRVANFAQAKGGPTGADDKALAR